MRVIWGILLVGFLSACAMSAKAPINNERQPASVSAEYFAQPSDNSAPLQCFRKNSATNHMEPADMRSCAIETRYLTQGGERGDLIFDNCFEQALVRTESGAKNWLFVDFAARDMGKCVADKPLRYVAMTDGAAARCVPQAFVLESQNGAVVPKWKIVSKVGVDINACLTGNKRFVSYIKGGMLDGCTEQQATTQRDGSARWISFSLAGVNKENCVWGERFEKSNGQCYRSVAVQSTSSGATAWTKFDFTNYPNRCE